MSDDLIADKLGEVYSLLSECWEQTTLGSPIWYRLEMMVNDTVNLQAHLLGQRQYL